MVLIDKAALLNKIAKEVHYDSEHSLEMYAKMLSLINDAPDGVVRCKDCRWCEKGEEFYRWCFYHNTNVLVNADYCSWGERREDADK